MGEVMDMADQATEPVFAGMAETAGLPKKGMYTLREVSAATGVARRTLDEEVRAGRLRTFVPPGRSRGRLVMPAWFDEWWTEGARAPGGRRDGKRRQEC
jgi:hypothetical protein